MPNHTPTPRKTTTQRGYGNNHRKNRTRLINRHIDGKRCTECSQPMYGDTNKHKNWDGKALEAHHPEGQPTQTTATILLHSICNRRLGDPTRTRTTKPITTHAETDHTLGHLHMNWPTP